METVSHPVHSCIPTGFEEHPCYRCQAAILVRSDTHETPTCAACLRQNAESAIHEAAGVLKALRRGEEPFAGMTKAERAEQLAMLMADDGSNPPPTLLRVSVRALTNDQLIDVVGGENTPAILAAASGELVRRLNDPAIVAEPLYVGGETPDVFTRDELESQIELIEAEISTLEGERDAVQAVRSRRNAGALLDGMTLRRDEAAMEQFDAA
jgi:uncharacterized small protein (DUF1192 family)